MPEGQSPVTEAPFAPPREAPGARHLVWLLVSLAMLSVFPYYERVNNPNENVRIYLVRAIVDHQTLQIGRVCDEWGYVNDKAIVDGRLYSGKAPGASFVGVPIYYVARAVARVAGAAPLSKRALTLILRLCGVGLPMSAFLYAFARWSERVTGSAQARDLLVAALGLGTMLFPYGVIFVGHALAAALAFSGFMLLNLEPREGARRWALALAGTLVGLAVVFEYQILFAALPIAVYALARHRRGVAFFALGAVPPALALAAYHTAVFGKPWDLPYNHIENQAFAAWHHGKKFLGMRLPSAEALGAVLFSPSLGLFVFSPYLLAGVAAALWLAARRARAEGLTILAVGFLMVLFLTGVPNWHAGWCVGPRYVAVVAPFLTGALALAWRRLPDRFVDRFVVSELVAGLVIPSVLLNVVSGALYPHYPEVFDNPVFDLTFPLIGAGYQPYSLGWLLGLRGAWSLLPLALLVVGALAPGLAGPEPGARRWLTHVGAAFVIAAIVLLPLSGYGRQPRADENAAAAFVRSTWEPKPAPQRP
ncbi:MAG TPA: hypothetical protein VHJ20_12225 [Polyangia bacterium]|nr:hypothetical protein [Polyangia bacterium]